MSPAFEITTDAEFEIWCARCGAGLCGDTSERHNYRGQAHAGFDIEPCEKCLQTQYDRGYEDAEEEGRE